MGSPKAAAHRHRDRIFYSLVPSPSVPSPWSLLHCSPSQMMVTSKLASSNLYAWWSLNSGAWTCRK